VLASGVPRVDHAKNPLLEVADSLPPLDFALKSYGGPSGTPSRLQYSSSPWSGRFRRAGAWEASSAGPLFSINRPYWASLRCTQRHNSTLERFWVI
jgi:hypothetical protein